MTSFILPKLPAGPDVSLPAGVEHPPALTRDGWGGLNPYA